MTFIFFCVKWKYYYIVYAHSVFGEGNGTPLQCSCLENPRDGGAWWAAVYGVAQSRTRLSNLAPVAAAHSVLPLSQERGGFPIYLHACGLVGGVTPR